MSKLLFKKSFHIFHCRYLATNFEPLLEIIKNIKESGGDIIFYQTLHNFFVNCRQHILQTRGPQNSHCKIQKML